MPSVIQSNWIKPSLSGFIFMTGRTLPLGEKVFDEQPKKKEEA
jgi:hypothetical protein